MNSRLVNRISNITFKSNLQNDLRTKYQWIPKLYSSTSVKNPFHRKSKYLQRERSAVLPNHQVYDYLKDSVGRIVADKLYDIKKDMEVVIDLGCGKGYVSKHLNEDKGMKQLFMTDYSPSLLNLADVPTLSGVQIMKKVVDEEEKFPFENNFADLVISNLNLHWVNNLPGCLSEVLRVLKRDGTFILSLFGEDTLYQLRSSLVLAELERQGGFASHVSPFMKVPDIGALLNQSGFTLLTFDTEDFTIGYPSIYELMFDLKGMAESNASINRKLHLPRDTLMAAAAIYQEMFGDERGIQATFQVIFCIGWKPDMSKPIHIADRGSGQVSMKDIERLNELIREYGMEGRIKYMKELLEKDKQKDPKKDK